MQQTVFQAAVYAFTPQGFLLGKRLAGILGGTLYAVTSLQPVLSIESPLAGEGVEYVPSDTLRQAEEILLPPACASKDIIYFTRLKTQLEETFSRYSLHIFIGAAGIAVRGIAPFLVAKETDPAVLVIDQRAQFIISLLSGHLGRANMYAHHIADLIGGTAVITTATDVEGIPALDVLAQQRGLVPARPLHMEGFKAVSASLLAGKTVRISDPDDWLGLSGHPLFREESLPDIQVDTYTAEDFLGHSSPYIVVSERDAQTFGYPTISESEYETPCAGMPPRLEDLSVPLVLHPPSLYVGVGCRRGACCDSIFTSVLTACEVHSLSMASIAALVSLDAKADEEGLLAAARKCDVPALFFDRATLADFQVTAPSPKAQERFGVPGVCEPAALAGAFGKSYVSAFFPEKAGGSAAFSGERRQLDNTAAYRGELLVSKQVFSNVTVAIALRHKL